MKKAPTLLAVALLLVSALTAHCSANKDDQTSEEDALIQSLLGHVTAQGQDILSAIEQQLSQLQDEEDEPNVQEIEDPLTESQEELVDQADEDQLMAGLQDKLSSQELQDSLSKLQDDEDASNTHNLFDLLASVQDEDDENEVALSDLALAQDGDDDDDIASLQALQQLLEASLQDAEDPRTKRGVEEQAPAQTQWWRRRRSRKRHYYNHQRHYYNTFVNVARSYM